MHPNNGALNSANVRLYTNGNLSRYSDQWGAKEIKLYKDLYTKPTINLNNSYLNNNTKSLFRHAPKIIVRGVSQEVAAIIDFDGAGLLVAVHSIIPKDPKNIYYLLGILNSRLINWFHLKTIYSIRIPQGSLKYPTSFFDNIPIPFSANRKVFDRLDRLVNENIVLNKSWEHNRIKIAAVESEIDDIVYQVYGITDAEQKIIEAKSAYGIKNKR